MTNDFLILADEYWPGPLTLIMPMSPHVPKVISSNGTIGMRIPNHPFLIDLILELKEPLIGTSANLSGEKAPTDHSEVSSALEYDYLIEGGRTKYQSASQVIDLSSGKILTLREGTKTIDIQNHLKHLQKF